MDVVYLNWDIIFYMKSKLIKSVIIFTTILVIILFYFYFQQNKTSNIPILENSILTTFETQPPTEVLNIAKNNLTPNISKTSTANSGPQIKLGSFYKIYSLSYKNISDFNENTNLFSVLEPRGWYYTTTADLSTLDNGGKTFQSWKDKGTNFDFYDRVYEIEFIDNSWQLVTNYSPSISIDILKNLEKDLPILEGHKNALLYIGHPPCAFRFAITKKDDAFSLYPIDNANWSISKELHTPFEVTEYIKSIGSCKQFIN